MTPAAQTITFGALSSKVIGAAPFTVSATASSGLTVSFSSQTPSFCTVSGTTVTLVAAGPCTVRASQAGNSNYAAATPVDQSFQILAGYTIAGLIQMADGTNVSGVMASLTGTQTRSYITNSDGTYFWNNLTSNGNYTVTPSGGGCGSFTPATRSYTALSSNQSGQNFVCNMPLSSQTITFGALSNRVFGTAPFTVSATATSGLAVGFSSVTTGVCTVSGSVTLAAVGTCTVRASQGGDATYAAATPGDQSFQETQASQTIIFGALSNRVFGTAPFTVSATASSGLPVSFSSLITSVCTVSDATVTLVGAGPCTIRASQAGNSNYAAATPVDQTFQVAVQAQTITFGALSNRVLGTAPFAVSATASSGLPVSFSSLTTGVCTISGVTVTLAAAGTCTIRASQTGNGSFAPAAPVDQSFQVTADGSTLSVGSTAVSPGGVFSIPVTLALGSGVNVDFLTFGLQVTPVGAAPVLAGTLTFTKDASIEDAPVASAGGTHDTLGVLWALSSPISGTRTLGVLSGTIPAGATNGQAYTVAITSVSASVGTSTIVTVSAGANGAINVAANYKVGDVYPYTTDVTPNFGDGNLNILDLIQVLFSVNSVPGFRPANCSDRFDAMDLYPVDTVSSRGGDGALNILDLIRELFRVNNLDTDRPVRATSGGVCASPQTQSSADPAAIMRAERGKSGSSSAQGALLLGPAESSGASEERIPVYLVAAQDLVRVALTFGLGDERSQLRFAAAPDLPASLAQDSRPGVVAAAWLDGVTIQAGKRRLLGYVSGPAGISEALKVFGVSATGLDDEREVRLDATNTAGLPLIHRDTMLPE